MPRWISGTYSGGVDSINANRSAQDILVAVVVGPKCFSEASTAVFPESTVQICIVHLERPSSSFCAWKDCKGVAASLRQVYGAISTEQADHELDAFEKICGAKYSSVAPASWRDWAGVAPSFSYSPANPRLICPTNGIERLGRVICKTFRTKGAFASEDAATKVIYLALRNFEKDGCTGRGRRLRSSGR